MGSAPHTSDIAEPASEQQHAAATCASGTACKLPPLPDGHACETTGAVQKMWGMRRPSTSTALRLLRAFRLAVLVSAAATGCGTSATITDRSGARQEGVFIRGNQTHLIVATTDGRIALRRDEIADVDHPGNVMAVVGAALLIPSAAWLVSPALRCEEGRETPSAWNGWAPRRSPRSA